jgi:hydroxymethylbilane synthase
VTVRLGTRGSLLALAQAEAVAAGLRARGATVEIVPIKTAGDRLPHVALGDLGGKALFVREIEEALLAGQVDAAVHSLKDLPALLPEGLVLAAFPPRADAADVVVSRGGLALGELAAGAQVGTSSLRRRALLLARRPDLTVVPLRGNVETRLRRIADGSCEAVILARAGLARLGLVVPEARTLSVHDWVPAVGQGILAVEARQSDREMLELLSGLDHTETRQSALAERAFLERLGADCHTPVAGHALWVDGRLHVKGLVASLDGRTVLEAAASGPGEEGPLLGRAVGDALLDRGARALLDQGRD